jgi:hypothetical protein
LPLIKAASCPSSKLLLPLIKAAFLPLIKAARGKKIIIMGPMPRYLLARCCASSSHLTNKTGEEYIDQMIQAIRDVYAWINNTIFMRRIKGVKVFNPTHALGFNDYDVNIDSIIELWGEDPVHPTPAAYRCWLTSWWPWWTTDGGGRRPRPHHQQGHQEEGCPQGALDCELRASG